MKYIFTPIVFLSYLFLILFNNTDPAWGLTEKAQDLYARVSPSVYQIQVIDLSSGEKSVIGSGFRFSKSGLFATNYHVISDVADKPDRYRIEYHKEGGKKGVLILKNLDVVHDLAILKGEETSDPYLSFRSFRKSTMAKGGHVYPMGNPLDLGMTIVEGTYNGLVGEAPYERLLLSAPLNGGMSGGPALDSMGRVVGINVASQGENLSYLVPVKYLVELANETTGKDLSREWSEIIQDQVLKKYDHLIQKTLQEKWLLENFGSLKIPQNISTPDFKCWGNSKGEDLKEGQFYSSSQKWCKSRNSIYLSSSFNTGTIGYSFISMNSRSLNSLEFSKKYSNEFANSTFYPYATEKEVTEFKCENNFIKLADHDWKAVYCVRQYKKYPKLHDVFITFALLGEYKQGHIIRVGLAGIDEPLAGQFLQKILGGIQWVE